MFFGFGTFLWLLFEVFIFGKTPVLLLWRFQSGNIAMPSANALCLLVRWIPYILIAGAELAVAGANLFWQPVSIFSTPHIHFIHPSIQCHTWFSLSHVKIVEQLLFVVRRQIRLSSLLSCWQPFPPSPARQIFSIDWMDRWQAKLIICCCGNVFSQKHAVPLTQHHTIFDWSNFRQFFFEKKNFHFSSNPIAQRQQQTTPFLRRLSLLLSSLPSSLPFRAFVVSNSSSTLSTNQPISPSVTHRKPPFIHCIMLCAPFPHS